MHGGRRVDCSTDGEIADAIYFTLQALSGSFPSRKDRRRAVLLGTQSVSVLPDDFIGWGGPCVIGQTHRGLRSLRGGVVVVGCRGGEVPPSTEVAVDGCARKFLRQSCAVVLVWDAEVVDVRRSWHPRTHHDRYHQTLRSDGLTEMRDASPRVLGVRSDSFWPFITEAGGLGSSRLDQRWSNLPPWSAIPALRDAALVA